MAASIQRRVLLGALCLAIAAAMIFIWIGRAWWGAFVAAALLAVYPMAIAFELGMASVVARHSKQPLSAPPGAGQLIQAWFAECRAGFRVFCWQQPFRSNAHRDALVAEMRGRRGVVLVHGLFCNRGFWNPWMRRFQILGNIPFVALNLEPLFCSIDGYVGGLDAAVVRITRATGLAPVIVAHSMGGLVVRRWLGEQRSNGCAHHVVTIGTPHAGTWLARFAGTRNGREMAVDSRWLRALGRQSGTEDAAGLFTCFYGDCDNVVFPPQNATLPGARNHLLLATAHVQLAFRPEVIDEVLRWLGTDGPAVGPPASLRVQAANVVAQKTASDGSRSSAISSPTRRTRS